ncbi:DNA methyltransferase [Enterococcus faecalis]|uniref:DNA methyltransferase n=1 Tax=Enterococcus faecalis TaxID=1351 RepID=UPI0021C9287C|nr:DNA methyltransferase [Enterococcus faecalis]MCU2220015.1 DNA methyltransferase [Enterococcus faecalis]
MNILEDLNRYEEEFWDFKGAKKEGLHKLGKYPATMVAPMQYELLSIIKDGLQEHQKLLDPFMGSGTTLVEGHSLGMEVIGIDINPYAVLLSEVKTHTYHHRNFTFVKERIAKKLLDDKYSYQLYSFENIDKWFRQDIKDSLSKIRSAIMEESNQWVRKFLWICFSEVIYSHSNDRTSTFKLHMKKLEDIANITDNCIDHFLKKIKEKEQYLTFSKTPETTIFSGNSLKELLNFDNESIDIICTSPPYGDNGTTVTYGQATVLFLKWIDISDLNCDEEMLSNYSKIDSSSLGGTNSSNIVPELETASSYIKSLSRDKRRKVERFVADYYEVLSQLSRVLIRGGYMLFTVGNRRVDGLEQPLDKITQEIFLQLGLKEEKLFTRNILSKKMPTKLSRVKDKGAVKSMSQETVLIFKKE